MVYQNWDDILPKKTKYTVKDVNYVMTTSLFYSGGTLNEKQAFKVVTETAKLHGSTLSKPLSKDFAFYLKNKR